MWFVLAAGMGSAFMTCALLYPLGLFTAALVTPIAGSAGTLLAGLLLAYLRSSDWQSQDDRQEQLETVTIALRNIANQGRAVGDSGSAPESDYRLA